MKTVENAINEICQAVQDCKDTHTPWPWPGARPAQKQKAILGYMDEILENVKERYNFPEYKDRDIATVTRSDFEKWCLNGADNWHEYSWGGSSLVYNDEIIEYIYPRYMVAKMIRKCDKGYFKPLDVQTMFLKSAFVRCWHKFAAIQKKEAVKEG